MTAEEALAVDLETQKAWARTWQETGKALEAIRRSELKRALVRRELEPLLELKEDVRSLARLQAILDRVGER